MEPLPDTSNGVRQVPVPAAARALSTLPRAHYEDAFLVDVGAPHERTAEQWARAIMEGAPVSVRSALVSGWSALGIKLDLTGSGPAVLGWRVLRSAEDFVLLAAESHIGMPAQLLFQRRRRHLLFATFVRHTNPIARIVWAPVEPVHVRVVRRLLEQAGRRVRSSPGGPVDHADV